MKTRFHTGVILSCVTAVSIILGFGIQNIALCSIIGLLCGVAITTIVLNV